MGMVFRAPRDDVEAVKRRLDAARHGLDETLRVLPKIVIAVLVAIGAPGAAGQIDETQLRTLAADELKGLFVACEEAAEHGQLDDRRLALCSNVYEELKRQAFAGDPEKFFTWWRSLPTVRNAAR